METKVFLENILQFVAENHFSDLHITSQAKARIRNRIWDLEEIDRIGDLELWEFSKQKVSDLIKEVISEENFSYFLSEKEMDLSYKITSWDRFRVNCYFDATGFSIAFRLITSKIPTMEELWLWEKIKQMCKKEKWLILVTWPTGSWKSTNLASMINFINKNYKKHIITIEDPIEFSFESEKSLINQREVWAHTHSFERAIKSALREDPDVIMVWEMRDPETIKSAITLAETGHIVFSTLHTNDSVQTVDRIVDAFPPAQQSQIRMQLSQTLIWIISQRLLPRADWEWRVPAREILFADDAVKNLIINWKTHQLYSVLEVWKEKWMILMDKYLLALYTKKMITKDILLAYARDRENIEMMIS